MTRDQFISDLSHWNSYLPMLWMALEATGKMDVIEAGIGDGSTFKLHDYCQLRQRNLYSYESNLEWYRKFGDLIVNNENWAVHEIEYVGNNWEIMVAKHREPIGVLFSDEAPGEMRKYSIAMFCNTAQVIIAHDAEPSNDGGYKYSLLKPLFKYHKLHEFPGASTAAFSNFIDVSKWIV